MAVRPQLQAFIDRADAQRSKAESTLKKLKPGQLTWTSGHGRWTIAQVLDHLNKAVERTLPKFEEAIRNAPPAGDEVDRTIPYWFGDKIFLTMVGPNAPVKIPVPPIFEPEAAPNAVKVGKWFFELHDAYVAFVRRADAVRLEGLRVTSPVSDRFRPGLVAYMDANLSHEAYHLGQVDELLADPDFPK